MIAFSEGGVRPVEKDQDTALTKWSEPGLLAFLAARGGVEIASPEPDRKDELIAVSNKVGKDEAAYYYFARTLRQWQRDHKTPESFDIYIGSYLAGYKVLLSKDDFDLSLKHMVEIYELKHDEDFEPLRADVREDSTPGYNQAATASSSYRNTHMVREIIRLWQEGRSIFVIYGSGHLITQEKALEELLK